MWSARRGRVFLVPHREQEVSTVSVVSLMAIPSYVLGALPKSTLTELPAEHDYLTGRAHAGKSPE